MLKFGEDIRSSHSISCNFQNEKMTKGCKWQKLLVPEQIFLYTLFGLSFLSCVRQSSLNIILVHSRSVHYRTLLLFTCSFQYPLWHQFPVNSHSFTKTAILIHIFTLLHIQKTVGKIKETDLQECWFLQKSPGHHHGKAAAPTDTISPTQEHCNVTRCADPSSGRHDMHMTNRKHLGLVAL